MVQWLGVLTATQRSQCGSQHPHQMAHTSLQLHIQGSVLYSGLHSCYIDCTHMAYTHTCAHTCTHTYPHTLAHTRTDGGGTVCRLQVHRAGLLPPRSKTKCPASSGELSASPIYPVFLGVCSCPSGNKETGMSILTLITEFHVLQHPWTGQDSSAQSR